MRFHKFLYPRVGVPLLTVAFISANMEIGVREESRHLPDEDIEELVGTVACGIHGRIENAPVALDLVGAFAACQIRVANKPGGSVSRHVEFRDDSNATVARVFDHPPDFLLGVEKAIGALLLQ